ncbi:Hypothetical predicted protein [Pelobates cultripes]|uniref:Uncharacterized protein n=1 Tax=Pelobates cultripes TaxID=61616 RepID=A0AAD1S1K7_PELCU|nr:Hypothetical predicted protein [Pelobates cultripes]
MGKTRCQGTPGPSGNSPSRKISGPMDNFLSTPDSFRATRPADKMAAASLGAENGADSEPSSAKGEALSQITELAAISANMFTKSDKATMVSELRAAIREEILEVRRPLSNGSQSLKMTTYEPSSIPRPQTMPQPGKDQCSWTSGDRWRIWTIVEDVTISELEACQKPITKTSSKPLHSSSHTSWLKEAITRAVRPQTVTIRDASVSLYQDLSSLNLDARRALRPLNRILQEKRIPYKWGFPFCLQAKKDNT